METLAIRIHYESLKDLMILNFPPSLNHYFNDSSN